MIIIIIDNGIMNYIVCLLVKIWFSVKYFLAIYNISGKDDINKYKQNYQRLLYDIGGYSILYRLYIMGKYNKL